MDWRKRYAEKLRTPAEAVADIGSGQSIVVAMFDGMPVSTCNALSARAAELEDVSVFHFVSAYPWSTFNEGRAFRREHPLVAVADIEIGPQGREIEPKLTRGMGAVDHRDRTRLRRQLQERSDRKEMR